MIDRTMLQLRFNRAIKDHPADRAKAINDYVEQTRAGQSARRTHLDGHPDLDGPPRIRGSAHTDLQRVRQPDRSAAVAVTISCRETQSRAPSNRDDHP
jgi:hypothetical protein